MATHTLILLGACWPQTCVHAETQTSTASGGSPTQAISVSARLDFTINMGKFLFFRVGTGSYPTASSTIDTVSFVTQPVIPAGGVVPVDGTGTAVNWSGAAPTFSIPGSTVLPVEVRSNAGQVTIRATATTPLTSGANSIALSRVTIASSSTALPAPLIPDTGTGAAVNVAGTAFSNLVTTQSANWTFSFNPTPTPQAGTYNGQVTFTASSP